MQINKQMPGLVKQCPPPKHVNSRQSIPARNREWAIQNPARTPALSQTTPVPKPIPSLKKPTKPTGSQLRNSVLGLTGPRESSQSSWGSREVRKIELRAPEHLFSEQKIRGAKQMICLRLHVETENQIHDSFGPSLLILGSSNTCCQF